MIKVGSDFSGVGAFDQALIRLGIDYETIFACDIDKFARQTYILNYGEPGYYPEDVYKRDIPDESLDIYMTSPPCQAFSLAGKRLGEEDDRGILFYNSHEFIKINKPKYFIFENVKGLLSDDKGNTFARWVQYLGGKSVNGAPTIFPHSKTVPYHLYWKVLNAKDYNIPQNRERVFLVGIRDDWDNNFRWPLELLLEKRLKDVLEYDVDEKYYLSDEMINGIIMNGNKEFVNQGAQEYKVYNLNEITSTLCAGTKGYANGYIKIKSNTSKGYELAKVGCDSINFEHLNSKTRRGRVGHEVSQTITTQCNQGVFELYDHPRVDFKLTGGKWDKTHEQSCRVYDKRGISPTLNTMQGGNQEPKIMCNYRVRKLTPRECFRLMDFPDTFKWDVSDTQAYKQAGNSIAVGVLYNIIKRLLYK